MQLKKISLLILLCFGTYSQPTLGMKKNGVTTKTCTDISHLCNDTWIVIFEFLTIPELLKNISLASKMHKNLVDRFFTSKRTVRFTVNYSLLKNFDLATEFFNTKLKQLLKNNGKVLFFHENNIATITTEQTLKNKLIPALSLLSYKRKLDILVQKSKGVTEFSSKEEGLYSLLYMIISYLVACIIPFEIDRRLNPDGQNKLPLVILFISAIFLDIGYSFYSEKMTLSPLKKSREKLRKNMTQNTKNLVSLYQKLFKPKQKKELAIV